MSKARALILSVMIVLAPASAICDTPAKGRGFGLEELDVRLPAPDWQDCEPVSDDFVCMDLEQLRLVLKVYAAYIHARRNATLYAELLEVYETQNEDLVRNTQDLMVQLHAAHLTMEKRQQLSASVSGQHFGHTTTEVLIYIAGALVAGYLVSYYVHQ